MKVILLILVFFCAISGCAVKPGYIINGNFKGGADSIVRIMEFEGQGKYSVIDSAKMRNGKFVMKGIVNNPKYLVLNIGSQTPRLGFWIENSKISMDAHSDSLYYASIKGSVSQLEYEDVIAFVSTYDNACRKISQDLARVKETGNEILTKVIQNSLDSCWKDKILATIQYIKKHPSSYPAAARIKSISYDLSWQEQEEVISYLDPEVAKSDLINSLKKRIEVLKKTDVDKKAPDFTMPDTNGQPVNFYDQLSKNKLVLLEFWAAWCGPCRRENPNLVATYNKYHKDGFNIVAVSLDKNKKSWLEAIEKDGLPWIHVANLKYWDNPVVKEYGINSVPSNILINKDGIIVGRNLKGDELSKRVGELLKSDDVKQHAGFKNLKIKGLPENVGISTVGNLVGSNNPELILGSDSLLYVYSIEKDSAVLKYSTAFQDNLLELKVGDADNNGLNELIAVTGKGGSDLSAPLNIYIITPANEKWELLKIYSKSTPRAQSTYLAVEDIDNDGRNEIIASYFESKYIVETVIINHSIDDGWKTKLHGKNRMAMARDIGKLSILNANSSVIGRPYGDSLGDAGDAYMETMPKEDLPSFRGVKSIKIGDGDNNKVNEIYLGDGWHQDYGKIARGRLAVIRIENGSYKYELIEDVKYQYETTQIEIEDLTGDNKNELISRGNKFFRIYNYIEGEWAVFTDTAIKARPFSIGDINGDGHKDVIFTGTNFGRKGPVEIYNFMNLNFSHALGKAVETEVIDPKKIVGFPAPELKVATWHNGSFDGVNENKGKVILLDFWATWCQPCIKMFPKLRSLQEKYGDKGLQIIGLTKIDNTQSLKTIEAFVENESFPYPIGVSEEPFNNLSYGVGGIPHIVLIDKNGIIKYYEVGANDGKDLETEILKLLN